MVEKFPVGILLPEWIGILQDPTGSCRTCLTRILVSLNAYILFTESFLVITLTNKLLCEFMTLLDFCQFDVKNEPAGFLPDFCQFDVKNEPAGFRPDKF
jgi:hypothetical protein